MNSERNKKTIGKKGEDFSATYLQGKGLEIIERNFRTRNGEIDLVAEDGNTLVFVEVKTRRSESAGNILESINEKKQIQLRRIAEAYLCEKGWMEREVRFDVVGIQKIKTRQSWQVQWIKGAF
jgi:putative endonuclease